MRLRDGLFALLLLGPVVRGQASGGPLLLDDLRFADNLARYRYFDLAFDVLRDLRRGTLSAEDGGTVDFTAARIDRLAGEAAAEPDEQLKYQSEAAELLAPWANAAGALVEHPSRPAALKELADVLQARGRLRSAQRKAALADGAGPNDRADSLGQLAEADFQRSDEVRVALHDLCARLAAQRTEQGRPDEAEDLAQRAALCFYDRALLAMDRAEAGARREQLLEQANTLLGDYQWELKDESIAQYFAVHFQGVVKHRLGALDEALALQQEVLEKAQWFWDHSLQNPAAAPYVAELFDRTWGELAALQAEQGETQEAEATLDRMLAAHAEAKLPYGPPGLDALLAGADELLALGRDGKALDLVKLVADQGAATRQGEEARARLATLITGSGAAEVSPAVLMAAAKGLADRREYAEAAFQYTRAAALLASDAERAEHLVPAWLAAGRAYAADRHFLQAALCFEHALDAALAQDAPQELRESAATGMYDSFDRRAAETKDPFDKALRDLAADRLLKLGIAADLVFLKAKEAFQEAAERSPKDPAAYSVALTALQAVPPDAPSYELSLVYQGRALAGAGRLQEALLAFDALLARAADPGLAAASAEARNRREIALGLALYYKAELLLSDGVARPADALALLDGFESRLPSQAGLFESVKFQRVVALAQRGDAEGAAAALADLSALRPDSSYLRLAWFRLSDALLKAQDAARVRRDGPAADRLLERAADALWNSAELAGFPSFANLLSTGDWYARVGRHDLAQRSYLKAMELFGKDGSGVRPEQLDDARLGLALACNQLLEFGRARPLWKELELRRSTDIRVLVGAARGYGGWLARGADGSIAEVSGSGDCADARRLWLRIFASAQSSAQHQRIWWESKLGSVYALYRCGAADAEALAAARRELDNLALLYPDYDEDTLRELPREQQYAPTFKDLFKHLEQKLPRR